MPDTTVETTVGVPSGRGASVRHYSYYLVKSHQKNLAENISIKHQILFTIQVPSHLDPGIAVPCVTADSRFCGVCPGTLSFKSNYSLAKHLKSRSHLQKMALQGISLFSNLFQ